MNNINKVLIEIAEKSILEALGKGKKLNKEHYLRQYPQLQEKRATFVTLNKNKKLRGCIGSLIPHLPLIDDLIHNAKAAAFDDPRFRAVDYNEFKNLEIEISLLSYPKKIEYTDINDLKSKVRPYIDGVILKYSIYRATFLPQVWEQLPDFDIFFKYLCEKSGMNADCLKNHPNIEVYQVEKIT